MSSSSSLVYKTSYFDYKLDRRLIAQRPLSERDASRLLVLERDSGEIKHSSFSHLGEYLRPGDILVVNDSRVIPARLHGRKTKTGGQIEILLLERLSEMTWRALVGGKRIGKGSTIELTDHNGNVTGLRAEIVEEHQQSQRTITFNQEIDQILNQIGQTPLPPYIHEKLGDPERYQTIFNRHSGSSAAPTAGLHFTPDLLLDLRAQGILVESVTLHIGLDTFQPVRVDDISEHAIHSEWARLTAGAAQRINEVKLRGGRVIAVGTTVVRVLETAALKSADVTGSLSGISAGGVTGDTVEMCPWRPVAAFEGRTDLFIYPGYRFRVIDSMLTNFHLPRSTLLMLVAAFARWEKILNAYQSAMEKEYRFYSFGDAMLIL